MRLHEMKVVKLPESVERAWDSVEDLLGCPGEATKVELQNVLRELAWEARDARDEWEAQAVHDHHVIGCDEGDHKGCPCYAMGGEDAVENFECPECEEQDAIRFRVSEPILDALAVFQMTETPENAVRLARLLVEQQYRATVNAATMGGLFSCT